MKLFSIHVRRFGLNPELDVCAVREGFNFWAFLFTFFWALLKGYWLIGLFMFVLNMGISLSVAAFGMNVMGQVSINLAFHVLMGMYANDMARWTLKRRGYMEEDILSACGPDRAVEHYILSDSFEQSQ